MTHEQKFKLFTVKRNVHYSWIFGGKLFVITSSREAEAQDNHPNDEMDKDDPIDVSGTVKLEDKIYKPIKINKKRFKKGKR